MECSRRLVLEIFHVDELECLIVIGLVIVQEVPGSCLLGTEKGRHRQIPRWTKNLLAGIIHWIYIL